MSWIVTDFPTRTTLISARTATNEHRAADGVAVKSSCLASCYRGGATFGILWSVWERTSEQSDQLCGAVQRWIACDMLKLRRGIGWGYKSLTESMNLLHLSCPASYLEKVPIFQFGGNADWRNRVVSHQRRHADARCADRTRRSRAEATGQGSQASFQQLPLR